MEQTQMVQNQRSKELNTTMLILQCIGIVAVVFGHADIGGAKIPNPINYAFPYYSWHMPFFIFISGYFFNRTLPMGQYVIKKLRHHLVPALLVNAACGVLSLCLKRFGLASYGQEITWRALFVTPFTTGYQFYINVSLWFIFALIVIEVLSCVMDRLARNKADWVYLGLTLAVSLLCCYGAYYDHDGTRGEFLNAGLRLGFLLFFFWLGVCYRRYLEPLLHPFLNVWSAFILFAAQAVALGWTGYTLTCNSRDMDLSGISVPNGFWVAVASPITALLFFLSIAYTLTPYLKNSRCLQVAGRSTKYVVYYHQFLFVFCSFMLGALLKQEVIPAIPGFSFEKLYQSQYYAGGNPAIALVIALVSLLLPIVVGHWLEKKKWYVAAAWYVGMFLLAIVALYLAGRAIH